MDTRKLQVLKYPDENNSKRILAVSDANTGGDVLAYVEREMKTGALAELAHRWNAHPELVTALQDLTNTANHIESIMDGDKDKQKAWTVELHGIYGAIDRARTLLQSLQSNG